MSIKVKVYSESFRLTVVEEIAAGKWKSVGEAARAYGITGKGTVAGWLDKYGYGHLRNRVMIVSNEKPMDELKRLRQELREAKAALADMVLKCRFTEIELEVYAEQNGEDVETVKKKLNLTPLTALSKTRRTPRKK